MSSERAGPPSGSVCVLDSNVLLYAHQRLSDQASEILRRCSAGDLTGLLPSVVWAELSHRLMVAEAVATGQIAGTNPARKLAERPDTVRSLSKYRVRLRELASMGLKFAEVTKTDVLEDAPSLQSRYGLLTNDSIVLACAARLGADALVTCDAAFRDVRELPVILVTDVLPPPGRA